MARAARTTDLEHRLERVEAQHADYVSVLSSHTATLATLVAQVTAMQQALGQVVAEVAAVRQDVSAVAGRLESLEGRFDRLDEFLRSKLNGGSRQ
jgi:hypothetical protein